MSNSPTQPGGARQRVVLDCDTANEIDDQFAIAYALGAPATEVLGVISVQNTIVHGPDSARLYTEEAERIVGLCGRSDVPCPTGAASPMEDARTPVDSDGLAFLAETAREGPFTLLATGPATDAASFVLAYPELARDVEIIWAGAFPDHATWRTKKFGELNARADIQSWRALFAAETPLRVLPGWPGVEKVGIEYPAVAEQLRGLDVPVADYLAELLDGWIAKKNGQWDMDSPDRGAKVLWDVVNVAALSVPEAVSWETRPLPTIDPAGYPDWDQPGRSVPWGLDVDATAVLDDLWEALGATKTG